MVAMSLSVIFNPQDLTAEGAAALDSIAVIDLQSEFVIPTRSSLASGTLMNQGLFLTSSCT